MKNRDDCTCKCHVTPGMMHIAPCCSGRWVNEPKVLDIPKLANGHMDVTAILDATAHLEGDPEIDILRYALRKQSAAASLLRNTVEYRGRESQIMKEALNRITSEFRGIGGMPPRLDQIKKYIDDYLDKMKRKGVE